MARELIILPRFERDYRNARRHAEFDVETLEYIFDVLISGDRLRSALREHRLGRRGGKWSGFTECRLGADLLLIYRVRQSVGARSFCTASGRTNSCSGRREPAAGSRRGARPSQSRPLTRAHQDERGSLTVPTPLRYSPRSMAVIH